MKPILIVKVGDTFPEMARSLGDFEHWVAAGLGEVAIQVVDPRRGEALPFPESICGAIVTGSHSMVTDREGWSEALGGWLVGAVARDVPVLGICFGHQLLAQALGGEVGYHPGGMEIGTVAVEITAAAAEDALLGLLPRHFPVQVIHSQSVRRLPPGAVLLAGNDFEPHQAFRIGDWVWGVQFHPEFAAEAMRAYVRHLAPDLAKSGRDPDALAAAVEETAAAAGLLAAFVRVVRSRDPGA